MSEEDRCVKLGSEERRDYSLAQAQILSLVESGHLSLSTTMVHLNSLIAQGEENRNRAGGVSNPEEQSQDEEKSDPEAETAEILEPEVETVEIPEPESEPDSEPEVDLCLESGHPKGEAQSEEFDEEEPEDWPHSQRSQDFPGGMRLNPSMSFLRDG